MNLDTALQVLKSSGPAAAALGLGWFLRQSVCNESDGETAARFAQWVTLPALILQTFSQSAAGVSMATLTMVTAAYASTKVVSAALVWLSSRSKHPRERGVLVGCSVGSLSPLFVLPLLYNGLFGELGQRVGLLCVAVDLAMSTMGSYSLFSTAGAAFPESFEHIDGGRYRGEWKGMLKDGFGVYTYPSGARYEGEWKDGVKEGRGVYYFPKGGVYEGEWRGGVMSGIGIRTFGGGKVKTGIWREGKFESILDELQCVLVVEGANEAAAVARHVDIGSASLTAVIKRGLAVPGLWALLIALMLQYFKFPLPPSIDTITRNIAPAHGPLALISVGLLLDVSQRPKSDKDADTAAGILFQRLMPTVTCALLGVAALRLLLHQPMSWIVEVVGAATLCGLAPIAPTALQYAHTFRLNENIVAITRSASMLLGFILVLMVASSILVSQQAVAAGASYAFAFSLLASLATIAFIVPLALRISSRKRDNFTPARQENVKMLYTGQVPAQSDVAGLPKREGGATPPSATAAAIQKAWVDRKKRRLIYMKSKNLQLYRSKTGRSFYPFNLLHNALYPGRTIL